MRSISVSGMGEVKAKPDIAHITVGVTTANESAKTALSENTKAMQAIFDAMAEMNIGQDDIQTSNFSVNPQYGRYDRGEQPPKITGYQVNNSVNVTIRDLDALGQALDKLISVGANQVNSIQFGFSDPSNLENDARKAAVKDARAKAELYAETAGVKLGQVISIQEGYVAGPVPMARMETMAMDSAVPIAPGQQTVSMQVSVVYALE